MGDGIHTALKAGSVKESKIDESVERFLAPLASRPYT